MGQNGSGPNGTRSSGPRCIALVGPFQSGKTTLLEAILARTGAVQRQGTVDAGTTIGDASKEARHHKMSVELNFAETTFMGDSYTFLDCPGSVEFNYESAAVLPAVDAAIVVGEPDEKKIPQLAGGSARTGRAPHSALPLPEQDRQGDNRRARRARVLQPASARRWCSARSRSGRTTSSPASSTSRSTAPLSTSEHAPSEVIELEDDERSPRDEARFTMLERLADHDDALMEQLLEDIQPPRDKVFADLVAELRAGQIVPVLHRLGRERQRHPAAPEGAPPRGAERRGYAHSASASRPADAVAQVMKTIHTSHAGKLSVARVLAGQVDDGMELTHRAARPERSPASSS